MTKLSAIHAVGSEVALVADDVELFRYVYAPDTPQVESPRPYIHPIRTLEGELVSLFRPHDHVWHKGISWALPVVEDENFWGGGSYVHPDGYVLLPNNGSQVTASPADVVAGETVRISHTLTWQTQSGEAWFREERSLTTALLGSHSWGMVFETAMENIRGADISIGSPTTRGRENAGYGGLFWRGPRAFTNGTLVAPGTSGGDELRGQRFEWMAFAGRHDGNGASSVVLMLDDESNLEHPPQWFARSEEFAALNPAPFFAKEHVVPVNGIFRARYGVGISRGDADRAAPLADAVRTLMRGLQ